jgi:NADH:ubiquinone oxidoreductase subunit
MPLIRKIIQVGTAKAVSLPAEWLRWIERETGVTPKEVAIEVDRVLTIKPVLPKKAEFDKNE